MRLPQTLLLVVFGAIGAFVVTDVLGMDTGLRAANFYDLVFYVFLPVLVFTAAYHLPARQLTANLGIILFLAVGGMLATAVLCAGLVFWGIGHPSGFPWIAALITGTLLAATDPVAVVAQLKELGAPQRLATLLEGESLFNDATVIVLFGILLAMATSGDNTFAYTDAALHFMMVFFGGAAVGAAGGLLGSAVLRLLRPGVSHALVSLAMAYGTFLLAETLLEVSGIMATLLAGLLLARAVQRQDGPQIGDEVGFTLDLLAYAANGSVFLLVGMTITGAMFTERWLAMLIAIGAVLLARLIMVFGASPLLNATAYEPLPIGYQAVIAWGGLRGAVTLALALALPTSLDYWWTIQSMAFGVVLFTLFVQAPTMPWLIRRAGVPQSENDDEPHEGSA
ncbi:MAG: sodium:proton antiporter [Woeseiaceae bacterium]|nr:sodium:proton antiporter [Woeseiaceae bacterium]